MARLKFSLFLQGLAQMKLLGLSPALQRLEWDFGFKQLQEFIQ
jgi:hypothetical protein